MHEMSLAEGVRTIIEDAAAANAFRSVRAVVLEIGELAAVEAQRVIDRINLVAERCRAAARPVIFIQHETAAAPLQFDSPGWQLAEGLRAAPGDLRVRKRTPEVG